ncbi:PREDICTED: SAC3 family protein B isoform X2 [Tarenaya hassleriana]|uniref:SAC3 family protein B isoform X2 n=1 Tax=Tarenaya hassleriana TaxID=28532 RepID=UPI0008FCEA94|nr:PREDICTED: SAC3 family protein B isoform X2 [Tarenaya hassleriana]
MAFRPFGRDVGPSTNPKASPFTSFGSSPPAVPSSGPLTQRAQPLAFQNPSPSAAQPYRPVEIQSGLGAPNRFPSPNVAYQYSPSPYQAAGVQRSFSMEHGEQNVAASPPSASYVLSRSYGSDAAVIGRLQDPRRKSRPDHSPDKNFGFPQRKQLAMSGFENGQSVDDFQLPSSQTCKRSPSSAEANLVRFKSNARQVTHVDISPNPSYPDSYEVAEIQVAARRKPSPAAPSNRVLQDNSRLPQNDSRRVSNPPGMGTRIHNTLRSSDSVPPAQSSFMNSSLNQTRKTTVSPAAKRTRSPPLLSIEEAVQGNSGLSQDGTEREEQAKAKRLARFKAELEPMAVRSVEAQDTKPLVNRTMKPLRNKQNFSSLESNRDALNGDALLEHESSEQSSIIGLCPDMCPESEREERERKGDLDKHERVNGDRNQTSKYIAVKKYNRTAEREAILIRPMPILQKTMDYLLSLLDQSYDDNFLRLYNFLWDRMRAIRMDLRMQHIFNEEAIIMLEQMIRLHIIAMHELCEYTKGEGFSEGFDAHLNIEQMNKTSVELFQMYDDHGKKGINITTEKEFRGYYALLKLDKHPGYKVEPAELSLELAKMTPEIRQTSEVLFARDVARACRTGNFIAFFRLARKASYLQACLMHAHFAKLRTQALASLHSSLLNNQGLPVSDVSKWIGMEEEDIETLLEFHGFSIKEFDEPYMMKDGPFLHVEEDYPTKCSKLVHLKKSRTIMEDVFVPSSSISSLCEAAEEYLPGITTHGPAALPAQTLTRQTPLPVVDKEMTDTKTFALPEEPKPVAPEIIKPKVDQQKQDDLGGAGGFHFSWKFSSPPLGSPIFPPAEIQNLKKQSNDHRNGVFPGEIKLPFAGDMPMNLMSGSAVLQSSPKSMPMEIVPITSIPENSSPRENSYSLDDALAANGTMSITEEEFEDNDNGVITNHYDEEVASAKLRLMIRLWKRWSSRQRESREHRQLAAIAALSSLTLGPPIQFNKNDQPRASGEINIDQAMRKRLKKHEQSWSRLNISDVIADILSERNLDSKCVCWKLILCTQMKPVNAAPSTDGVMHSTASQWLLSKLTPGKEDNLLDDNLLLSAPGISVWSKWVSSGSDLDLTCCLSVATDIEANDDLLKTTLGASAVLFLVSTDIPWNLQRQQLNSLLTSVPPGSYLPLLIVINSCNGDSMDIVLELGLDEIDKSRISAFSVVSLYKKAKMGHEDQFFSDKRLRDGLKWLASNSPLQPNLHRVKPRELVLTHLSFTLELLKTMPDQEVGPNLCISAFNDALDQSKGNICSAVEANAVGWPCPEIELLEDQRREGSIVKRYLPVPGWSSAESIEPLKYALENCKLPSFHEDLTWLTIGCAPGAEVVNQTRRLESCVIDYLTQTSNLMGETLAAKEARVMVQRNTRLELHNLAFRIIPRWVGIFQRIFNWRLMGLLNPSSQAYVLESDIRMSASSYVDKYVDEDTSTLRQSSPPSLPLLDEMIQVSYGPLKSPLPLLNHEAQEDTDMDEPTELCRRLFESPRRDDVFAVESMDREEAREDDGTMRGEVEKGLKGEDRLGELLEKCNILQNSIDDKLSIYF